MGDRLEEINLVINMINRFCLMNDIALIPRETEKGIKYVGVLDNRTGKDYALVRDK